MTPRRLHSVLIVALVAAMFALSAPPSICAAPKYKVVHAFGVGKDGVGTWGSLIFDKKGNLYGTTVGGGFFGWGTAFELTPAPNGKWRETILHSFDRNGQDGYVSTANLTFDAAGNLYGTTQGGGAFDAGTVFELVPGSSGWIETVLYSFGSHKNDSFDPYAGVAIDEAGNLLGTAGGLSRGSVYGLFPNGDQWTEEVIHDFYRKQGDGGGPFAGVILDAKGNLYGTTEGGGAYQAGTVYELSPSGGGHWKERLLYSFCPAGPPCIDGGDPGLGVLAIDRNGSLYGTTSGGGANNCGEGNCGVIFRLARHGSRWIETVLYNFQGGLLGYSPGAGVVRDKAGNLYGTTLYGGDPQCGCGMVFKLSPRAHGKWKYTVLHEFKGYDGSQPDANLTLDEKGNVYGTAVTGGPGGGGVVFEISHP